MTKPINQSHWVGQGGAAVEETWDRWWTCCRRGPACGGQCGGGATSCCARTGCPGSAWWGAGLGGRPCSRRAAPPHRVEAPSLLPPPPPAPASGPGTDPAHNKDQSVSELGEMSLVHLVDGLTETSFSQQRTTDSFISYVWHFRGPSAGLLTRTVQFKNFRYIKMQNRSQQPVLRTRHFETDPDPWFRVLDYASGSCSFRQ